jgi:hypothetical protein
MFLRRDARLQQLYRRVFVLAVDTPCVLGMHHSDIETAQKILYALGLHAGPRTRPTARVRLRHGSARMGKAPLRAIS